MDGVIFREKNFWLIVHSELGTKREGVLLTEKYLKTNYKKLTKEVLRLWKGKSAAPYLKLIKKTLYVPGAKTTIRKLKKLGYYLIIISSGSFHLLRRAMHELPVDEGYANELVIKRRKIIGVVRHAVKDGRKLPVLQSVCKKLHLPLKMVAAVGDSENDIPIFRRVGFSIAFQPESKNVERAAVVTVRSRHLTDILRFFK